MRISDWSSDVCSSDLFIRVRIRQVQHDTSANRTPDQSGLIQRERVAECQYRFNVKLRRQSILLVLPSFGRIRLPMPGHVESKNPIARCDFGIAKHMTVLPVIGASRMQADQWNTRSRFFRSEEHTSELQSLMRISYAVFCLQKKKNK